MNELQDIVLSNRYNLIQKIGEGGMALVYKAKDLLLNRYVAVKILRPEFTSDPDFVNKFRRESLAAASLSHPNIVGIFDVGEQEGIQFIVLEYVSGKTLKEYIRECGRVNYREALNITNQIASALDHAHKNGVVHRDIKPHNILVTEDKMIKVTDFGIAKASNASTIINTGAVMGSVHYFSPEQARGNYSDHRTDIYSLGVVLYEMLTGSLPYDADSPVTVALKHIQEDFVQPTIVVNSIPEAINDIVVKAMEKDMNMRYQTAKELMEDIDIARNNPYQKIAHPEDLNQMTQKIPMDKIDKALNGTQKTKKGKKKRRIVIASAVLAILVIFVLGAAYGYNKYFNVPNVNVPSVIGLTKEEALTKLTESKLNGVIGEEVYSDKEPTGNVAEVEPGENEIVKENSDVVLKISKGIKQVLVPDLKNKPEADALLALQDNELTVGTVSKEYNSQVPKGAVIRQDPEANVQIEVNGSVNYTLSLGEMVKMVTVPEMIGFTEAEARKALSDAGIQIGKVTYIHDENTNDDYVTAQSDPAYTQIPQTKSIDIQVNKFTTVKVQKNNSGNSSGNGDKSKTTTPGALQNGMIAPSP